MLISYARKFKKRLSKRMSIQSRLVFILLLVVILSMAAVFGLYQEAKGSRFQQLNFLHLKYSEQLHKKLPQVNFLTSDIEEIRHLVLNIRTQPQECIALITFFDRFMMYMIGTDHAIELCENDIKLADRTLAQLDKFQQGDMGETQIRRLLKKAAIGFITNSTLFEKPIGETVNFIHSTTIAIMIFFAVLFLLIMLTIMRSITRTIELRQTIMDDLDEQKQIFETLYEKTSDAILLLEGDRIIDCNDASVELFAAPDKQSLIDVRIKSLSTDIQPDGQNSHTAFKEVMNTVKEFGMSRLEWSHKKLNREELIVEMVLTQIQVRGNNIIHANLRDIGERKKSEEALQLASMVYQHSDEAMAVLDADNRVLTINPAFTAITGYQLDEIVDDAPRILGLEKNEQVFNKELWNAIETTGYWQGELWTHRKNGDTFAEWMTLNTLFKDDGSILCRVILFSDITDKKDSEALIWNQANFDSLTNLPNRNMLSDRLDQEIKKSQRTGLPIAVILLDLDQFKEVNDSLGHNIGDLLLKETASRLTSCVRDTDTIARLGGDEFIVVLPELSNLAHSEIVSENILNALSQPFKLGDELIYISASLGVTFYPEDAKTLDTLLKNADQAMYSAKAQGRNRFHYFTTAMQEAVERRMLLTNDLRTALELEQFQVYYQPIVDLASHEVYKAEALIRWHHPTRGLVSPVDFIPLAEDTGMISKIGEWVFKQSVLQVKKWRETHHCKFQISVNASPVQFQNEGINQVDWLEYLDQFHLSGQSIAIEITESLLLNMSQSVVGQLHNFHNASMQVSLDDFGTGYSSLSYLKKFDIDYLKIDRSFVRNLSASSSDYALCEAIVVMAHKLGLKVIAEGVETKEQQNLLTAIGCDYGQGFLFSKPVSAPDFDVYLSNHKQILISSD